MTGINHILFPTDGSDNSIKALEYVKEIAAKSQAKVTVMNSFELPVLMHGVETRPNIFAEVSDFLRNESGKLLNKTREELKDFAFEVDIETMVGHTGEAIIKTALEKEL